MAKDKGYNQNNESLNFSQLMQNVGVVPLKGKHQATYTTSTVNTPKIRQTTVKTVNVHTEHSSSPIIELSNDITDTTLSAADVLSFCSQHIPKNIFRKFRKGRFPIADELDLHGLTRQPAQTLLLDFLNHTVIPSQHCVRIIHGKGHRSTANKAVLKTKLNHWLQQHARVLAFHSCIPADGGTGAVYVLLRLL
jgi:DNA-nicking Smr family endonuclease